MALLVTTEWLPLQGVQGLSWVWQQKKQSPFCPTVLNNNSRGAGSTAEKRQKAGRTCPHSRNEDMTHMIISSALFGAAELIGNRWTNRRGHFCVRQVTRPRSAAGVRSTQTTGRRRPRLDAWETVRKEGVTAGNIKVAAGSRSLRPPSQINENIKQSSFLSEFPGPKRRKLTEVSVSSDRVNSHRQTTSA